MDVGAFVAENKRWLIGCAIGGLVWLIASSVINSMYDPTAIATSPKKLGAPTTPVYDQNGLQAAQQEGEKLAAERQRLQSELAFVVAEKYRRWNGPADQYLYVVGRDLEQGILQRANERDVQVSEANIDWEVPTGVDDIRLVLFGLDLIDEIQARLFAANDAAENAEPEALGLTAILSLKLEPRRNQRGARRPAREGEVDIDDLLEQQRVLVQFQSDEPTLAGFLEALRKPNRTLVVDAWQVIEPTRPGEPCTVKATLAGIQFKEHE